MTNPEPGVQRRTIQGWRAVLEIALFATAAFVLVTGADLTTVRRALARFPGAPVFQAPPAAPAEPAAAPRRASLRKAPAAAPAPTVGPSVLIPAPAKPAAKARPQSRPAATSPPAAVAPLAAQPTAAPAEETRIPHFYSLMDTGIALYNDGWYGPALARFRLAAGVMPGSPYAHLWWGRAAVAAGRPDEARQPLERAIALAPGTEVARKALLLLQQLN